MALTKVAGDILDPGIVVAGIVTATGFSGPFSDGTTGSFSGDVTVGGNLTVNGDYTTLNTTLREVEILRVDTNSTTAAGIITQTGSGDILNLFDGTTEVFKVADGGQTTIATTGYPQLILKDSDSNSPNDTNGISLRAANNTEYGFIGQTESGGHSLFIKTVATTNPIRLQVNSTTRLEVGNTGCFVTGVLDVASGGTSSLRGDVYIPDKLRHIGDDDTSIRFPENDIVSVETGGTERLRIDSAGKVGIGSAIPAEKLDVVGTIQCLNELRSKTGNDLLLNAGSANRDVKIQVNDVNMMYVQGSTGNVGIGTDTPQRQLHVLGTTRPVEIGSTNATNIVKLYNSATGRATYNGVDIVASSTDGAKINAYGGSIMFGTSASNGSDATEKLRITSDGKVGINDDTPDATLSVGGATAFIDVGAAGGNRGKIGYTSNDLYFGTSSGSGQFIFKNNVNSNDNPESSGTERLRITSGGNLKAPDGAKIELGGVQTGAGDLSIWHDSGGNSYIKETGGGALVINADDFYLQNVATTTFLRTHSSGQIDLTHSGNTKLSTSSTGVTVTGEVAASQDYPNYRPTLDFNFVAVKKLDPRITYERTGPASYTDEFGIVKLVGGNAPRFDHDSETRECKGLLIEESRSNLIYPSSDWSVGNPGWTINNAGSLSVETHTDDTKDPAGTYTASKLVTLQGNTNTKDIWWSLSNITYTDTVKFAVSCFAKSTTGLHLQLRPRGQSSNRAWATYNLTTGVVGNSGGTTLVSTKIEKYPNGWYRCSLVFTGSGHSSTSLGTIIMDDGNDAEAVSHTGDGSKSIYLWGAQIEQSNIATSYIPTSTAATTRGSDRIMIQNDEFSDFYNPLESTICASFTHLDTITAANLGTNARLYRFRSSNTTSDTRIDYLSHTVYHPFISEDGNQPTGGIGLDAGTLLYEGQVNKTAVKVKENDFGSCINGGSVSVDTSGDWNPTNAFDEVSLGSSNGAANTLLMGYMQRFTYYPVALPDNQLKTLTS